MKQTKQRRQSRKSLSLFSLALLLSVTTNAAVFQAEDYSDSFDMTAGNIGNAYRADNVDIEVTTDTGGGFNVGWIQQNEWLSYSNLSIPNTGTYLVKLRVASPTGGSASVDLNAGSIVLGSVDIPSTGDWQNWQTVEFSTTIAAGTYSLGVFAQTGDWNFNWIEVVSDNVVDNGVVSLYEHCNYAGWAKSVQAGSFSMAALAAQGIADNQLSSISVQAGYEAILFDADNFAGSSVTVTGENNCLVNQNFNDKLSSLIVRTAGNGSQLTWADEFDAINAQNWTFETGGAGWGNNELQYYTSGQNAKIEFDNSIGSNVLVLEAREENPANYNCWYGTCRFTSTRMISRDKQSFKYGRIEARIRLPQTQGIWPAFWMLGDSMSSQGWPAGGEIDIMEHVGYEPTVTHGALHGPGYSGNTPIFGTHNLGEAVDARYHTYAVQWSADEIRWFVDSTEFYRVTRAEVEQYGQWVYDQPFWLLFNVAVGGNWPGSPDGSSQFPQKMLVDYIRVYQ